MVARELESGTHRLAWNQSVTRTRWLATKLAIIGAATAATTGLLSWAITTWAQPIDQAIGDRITSMVYGARGVVPVAYALFAFALGVTAGMLIRRTVPATAATLAVYVVAVAAMPMWISAHLVQARHATPALDMSELYEFITGPDGSMSIIGPAPSNAWVLSNRTITSGGQVFTGPADPQFCGSPGDPVGAGQACMDWVSTLGLRQDITYHPASHFWPLQWIEAAIFLALVALLTGFCFWWTRRRLT